MERFSIGLNYLGQGENIPFIQALRNCLLWATVGFKMNDKTHTELNRRRI